MRLIRILAIILFAGACALPVNDAFARGGGGFGGGSRGISMSSGSKGMSFGSSRGISAGSGSKGISFGSGASKAVSAPSKAITIAPPGAGTRTNFDSAGSRAKEIEKSGTLFRQAHPDTQKTALPPSGSGNTTSSRPSTTQTRYAPQPRYYPSGSTVVIDRGSGNDNTTFWLWYWSLSQSHRDDWIYNHRDQVSRDEYDELVRKDAQLEERLRQKEQAGTVRNPDFQVPVDTTNDTPSSGHFWLVLVLILFIASFIYIFFFHRFGTSRSYG